MFLGIDTSAAVHLDAELWRKRLFFCAEGWADTRHELVEVEAELKRLLG